MGGRPTGHEGPLAFVADLEHPVLDEEDRHHLHRALRLRPGDPLVVADGRGGWRTARFGDTIEPDAEITVVERPNPPLTIGLTPTKGDRPEWAVQKLTELSVDRIVILRTERSVVRWEEKAEHHLGRLRRVAREAAMQSRRVWLPEVLGVHALAEHRGAPLADPGGRPPAVGDTTLLCGPEGGWSDLERAEGRDRVALGGAVLRAETASVTAGVLLAALRDGLVRPA